MPDHNPDPWTERIKAIGVIVDQLFRYLGPLLTAMVLYYQSQATQVAVEVKQELKKATAEEHAKLAVIEKVAKGNAQDSAFNAAVNAEWKAKRTGDPADEAKAERAAAKVIAQSQDLPN